MSDRIDAKLAELGLVLPAPAAPVAAYVPTVEAGGFQRRSCGAGGINLGARELAKLGVEALQPLQPTRHIRR